MKSFANTIHSLSHPLPYHFLRINHGAIERTGSDFRLPYVEGGRMQTYQFLRDATKETVDIDSKQGDLPIIISIRIDDLERTREAVPHAIRLTRQAVHSRSDIYM